MFDFMKIMSSHVLTVYDMRVRCPICNDNVEPVDFVHHVLNEHPYFFVVWASMNMPWLYSESILYDDPYDIDNMSYEYLSELCELIGNHTQGVTNIQTVTTQQDVDTAFLCPICLDDTKTVTKINKCSHGFCSECITKWLTMHKTCPVCIQDVNQISSTFTSDGSCSSPSSMNTT